MGGGSLAFVATNSFDLSKFTFSRLRSVSHLNNDTTEGGVLPAFRPDPGPTGPGFP